MKKVISILLSILFVFSTFLSLPVAATNFENGNVDYILENARVETEFVTDGSNVMEIEKIYLSQEEYAIVMKELAIPQNKTRAYTYNQTVSGNVGDRSWTVTTLMTALASLVGVPAGVFSTIAGNAINQGARNVWYKCAIYSQKTPVTAQKRVYTYYSNSSMTKVCGNYTRITEYILD